MSERHPTGVYSKGEVQRYAGTTADAVALVFDGYKLVEDAPEAEQAEVKAADEKVETPKAEAKPAPSQSRPVRDTPQA